MTTFLQYLIFVFVSFLFLEISSQSSCSEKIWKLTSISSKLLAGINSETKNVSLNECATNCTHDESCISFGFNTENMTCYLYGYTVFAGGLFTEQRNTYYYWPLQNSCPTDKGYVYDDAVKVCYKFVDEEKDWSESMKRCREDGAHLFLPDNAEKLNLAANIVTAQGFEYAYLGATDANEEGVWNWLDGKPIERSLWFKNRPDNYGNEQHCIAIRSTLLDDKSCENRYTSFCEIFIKQD